MAVHQPYQPTQYTLVACPGSAIHVGGRCQCPAYNQTFAICHKFGHFAKVCCSRLAQQQAGGSQQQPNARTIRIQSQQHSTYSYTKCVKGIQNPHQQSLYKYHHPRVHAASMSTQIQEQIYVQQDKKC